MKKSYLKILNHLNKLITKVNLLSKNMIIQEILFQIKVSDQMKKSYLRILNHPIPTKTMMFQKLLSMNHLIRVKIEVKTTRLKKSLIMILKFLIQQPHKNLPQKKNQIKLGLNLHLHNKQKKSYLKKYQKIQLKISTRKKLKIKNLK